MEKIIFKECKLGDKFITKCGDVAILVNPLRSEFAVSIGQNDSHIFRVDSEGHNDTNFDWDIVRKYDDEVDKCAQLKTSLFKDAKFGDRFMTRDGHEAILYDKTPSILEGYHIYDLMVFIGEFDSSNWEIQQVCVGENGMSSSCEYKWDIVSKC